MQTCPLSVIFWDETIMDDRLEAAWRVRRANFPVEIEFYYPFNTVAISLTGNRCELNCAHCGGYYLRSMAPIWCAEVRRATSCLISGGYDASGKVPVMRHLERVKAIRPGRRMNWHVGLITEAEMQAIAPYVDVISFDFVGDEETISEVYGLKRAVDDYVETYRMLRRYATVIPHITIGLRGGEISGEYRALEMLQDLGIDGLVLIVFIPTPGTRYAQRKPPSIETVGEVMVEARLRFPDKPIRLGCMRPHGDYRHRLDPLAVRAGVNGIVSPASTAVRLAKELGLEIRRGEECCVLPLA